MAMLLLGLWLLAKQPPCADFLDGSCSPHYNPLLGGSLFWLGVFGVIAEGFSLLEWTVRTRRRRRCHNNT